MTLEATIKQLPSSAGIYQYFNQDGHLLYVGKAKNLSNRVKSYFNFTPKLRPNTNLSLRIKKMVEETISMSYIVVSSEHDALILENSLIKQLKPKYNILLRDDKTYPYISIDRSEKYPRFEITRKIIGKGDITYFGPYSIAAREILDSIYELTKLVQKKSCLKGRKLCLFYQIKKCLGPCALPVSKERYEQEVEHAMELIQNKKLLIEKLTLKMEFYAESLRFEEAAELRDTIEKIDRSQIKSDIDFATTENYDMFVVQDNGMRAVVVRIFMRNGKIISSTHDYITVKESYDEDEFYQRAIMEFYANEKPPIIAPILVAKEFDDKELIVEHLTLLFEKKAQIHMPKIGKKKDLLDLALLNANELLKQSTPKDNSKILEELQELFTLQAPPYRVEAFDNSHMSGEATVGSMIVYDTDTYDKKSYRTYHLDAKDEYGQMREMLSRRVDSFGKNPPPDLWVIDGGATLLKLACEILESNGVHIDVIAIAKEKIDAKAHRAKGKANDIIHTKEDMFTLKNSDRRLHWVQKLRDETHRHALAFHKKTKLKNDQQSQLLTLHGISQAKVKKLLNHFGTFDALRKTSFDEISLILNQKDAKTIKNIYK
ncbi:MAG: excinuclease ABC subunit UvrC [Sulfurimonadaceae bacterium]|jgi:excinuclease ABC subunit C|nr:excinuclease ABC subunit UvrC [Sulfurimonadaceae bacterium]